MAGLRHQQQATFRYYLLQHREGRQRTKRRSKYSTAGRKKRHRAGGNEPVGSQGRPGPQCLRLSSLDLEPALAVSHLRFIPVLPELLLFIVLWKMNTSYLVSDIREENH